jgi:hypothetical protein
MGAESISNKHTRIAVSKRNSATRRDTIHKPIEVERLQRLSEKLLEIAKAGVPTGMLSGLSTHVDIFIFQG